MMEKVEGVKVHKKPRRKLYDHTKHRGCNRLTLMLNQEGGLNGKDDGTSRADEKMPEAWMGITIFYTKRPAYEEKVGKRYLDTPKGLVVTEPTHAEEEDIRATYAAWSKGIDVYQLVLKENKKDDLIRRKRKSSTQQIWTNGASGS